MSTFSTASEGSQPTDVRFWFDPICPWTWLSSRWMLEVEQVRPVTTEWRMMSLAYLNLVQREGMALSSEMQRPEAVAYLKAMGWGPIRVCAAAASEAGDDVLGPLYTALGTRMHVHGRFTDPAVWSEALEEIGLPARLAEAATSDELDDVIIKSHVEAFDEVGLDVGAPVIKVHGRAYFGPVVSAVPTGDDVGRLWDGFVLVAGTEAFYEIKRSRDGVAPMVRPE